MWMNRHTVNERWNMVLSFVAILLFAALTDCGPEQQSGALSASSVPVSLSIAIPASVAAAPASKHPLIALVQRWLLPTNAWAATAADVSTLQVEVTAPDLPAPVRKGVEIPNPLTGGAVVEIALDVPVGTDRVFTASGLDRQGRQIFRGKSAPTVLEAGRTAVVEITLTDNTIITGAITGTVINATTQSPINGARVQLSGAISAVTAGDGQFTLTEVSQGSQILRVSAADFNDATQTVTVVAGQTASAGTIALTLRNITGTINGRILSDGDADTPVAGATVAVLNATPPLSVPSGADGRFTLTGVPQGAQTLQVSASGFNAATKTVTVVAGQSVAAGTIALTPFPTTGTVTGSIFTEGNADDPVVGATVLVVNTTPPLSVRTGTNGQFILRGVLEGAQTLRVSAQGFIDATRAVTVVAGQSVSTGPIALRPFPLTGRVTGTVTDATTNKPLDDASVAVNGTTNSTDTQPDGSFTLDGVLQGSQTLRVRKEGFNDATRAVTVVAGQSVSAGTIALTSTTGSITGAVVNATTQEPLSERVIRVAGSEIFARTRNDGSFTLEGIPPGAQTVLFNIPGFQEVTRTVTVVAGQSVSVGTIAMPVRTFTGTLIGKVVDEVSRAPIQGATVAVTVNATGKSFQGSTNADGTFTISDVTAGFVTITVSKSGFTSKTQDGSVKEREAPSNAGTIALTPVPMTGSITGRVVAGGTVSPIQGATVTVNGLSLSTTTDSAGNFTLTGVTAGVRSLTFSSPAFFSATINVLVTADTVTSLGDVPLVPRIN